MNGAAFNAIDRPATGRYETNPPMRARVYVTLKQGILDPQGKAIQGSLQSLGFNGVEGVRLGKYLELQLAETDLTRARAQVDEMCRKLLANSVIEDFRVDLLEGPPRGTPR
jgi:phosphoribosylformylglycinamidine synthase subunit PurS